jgi:hypothetical protein
MKLAIVNRESIHTSLLGVGCISEAMSSKESINRIVDGACNKKNAAMSVGMNSGICFTHFEAQSSGTNLLFSPALGLDTCEGEGESYQLFGALLAFSLSFGTLIPTLFSSKFSRMY